MKSSCRLQRKSWPRPAECTASGGCNFNSELIIIKQAHPDGGMAEVSVYISYVVRNYVKNIYIFKKFLWLHLVSLFLCSSDICAYLGLVSVYTFWWHG